MALKPPIAAVPDPNAKTATRAKSKAKSKGGSSKELTEPKGGEASRKWKRELEYAHKREKAWREKASKIVKRYRGEATKKDRFNVLWSNTEILRPAIYNSRANPDVRRRFRDSDPLGRAVAAMLERALMVTVDDYSTESAIKNDVLDALLPGRGISRVRYIASIAQMGGTAAQDKEAEQNRKLSDTDDDASVELDTDTGDTNEADEGTFEEVAYERVGFDHVDWQDYRQGYARTWVEMPWIAFRCKLDRLESESMFGEEAVADIEFTPETKGEDDDRPGDTESEVRKLAEFWEVWDKEGDRVFFVHDQCQALLFPIDNPKGEPPIEVEGFYPIPEPLRLIEDTGSLLPIPPFTLYEAQADQLDRVTARIAKVIDACKLRGVYDAKLSELNDLVTNDDNELTPIQNAQAWRDVGLDKAITWFPVEPYAAILTVLRQQQQDSKAIIDEITGISDINRGATDPQETATAQTLKANFASVRLRRMQSEVQRYVCDLLRLAAQVMAQKFAKETFAQMTEMNFPTAAEKQQLLAPPMPPSMPPQMMPPPGAPSGGPPGAPGPLPGVPPGMPPGGPPPGAPMPMPPPPPPVDPQLAELPTWEDIMGLMRDDALRQFKIDVETDSTVAGTLESDMAGMSQVLSATTSTLQGLMPLVSQGALPIEAAKEILLSMIRRARLGLAVEDAFEKLKAPPPPPPQSQPDPSAGMAQAAAIKAKADTAIAMGKAHSEAQLAAGQAQADQQIEAMRQSTHAQLTQLREQNKAEIEQMREQAKHDRAAMIEQFKNDRADGDRKFDAAVKIIVAQIAAKAGIDQQVLASADATFEGAQDASQIPLGS